MPDYAIERDATGAPCRMWWVPPEERPRCGCGAAMSHVNHEGEPECEGCWKRRAGWVFRGRNPACRWCGGERGCLMCGQEERE